MFSSAGGTRTDNTSVQSQTRYRPHTWIINGIIHVWASCIDQVRSLTSFLNSIVELCKPVDRERSVPHSDIIDNDDNK